MEMWTKDLDTLIKDIYIGLEIGIPHIPGKCHSNRISFLVFCNPMKSEELDRIPTAT